MQLGRLNSFYTASSKGVKGTYYYEYTNYFLTLEDDNFNTESSDRLLVEQNVPVLAVGINYIAAENADRLIAENLDLLILE